MEIDKERVQSLIKFRALGKELLTKSQQKIIDLLEVKT